MSHKTICAKFQKASVLLKMDKLLCEDMNIFDKIDQKLLEKADTTALLNEDMDLLQHVDPQKLIYEAMLEKDILMFENVSTQDAHTQTVCDDFNNQIPSDIDYETFIDEFTNDISSTQFMGSPMHFDDTSENRAAMDEANIQEILPLLTPSYNEEYTISQILGMFDEED